MSAFDHHEPRQTPANDVQGAAMPMPAELSACTGVRAVSRGAARHALRMTGVIASLAVALGAAAEPTAPADAASSSAAAAVGPARARHVSQCVAALRTRSEATAQAVRGGEETRKPALLLDLQRGAAFIGNSYLEGFRDEDAAKARLEQAAAEQRTLAPAALSELQQRCAREADVLLADTNALERLVVNRLANKRMERLLRGE